MSDPAENFVAQVQIPPRSQLRRRDGSWSRRRDDQRSERRRTPRGRIRAGCREFKRKPAAARSARRKSEGPA
jgi:hypothetical protein